MSLNVGGLYVGVKEGVGEAEVAEAIDTYWRRIGALPLGPERDPLEVPPLSLGKSAELAFAVCPRGRDERGSDWIAVYDSERYTADPALACHLAFALGVPVVFYEISGSSGDRAYVKAYGEGAPALPQRDDVQIWVEGFPFALLYFNQLKEHRGQLEGIRFFGFREVPHRPGAKYSGASVAELDWLALHAHVKARFTELADAHDAQATLALGTEHPELMYMALDTMARRDLADAVSLAFVLALATSALQHGHGLDAVAEAAVRTGDEALLERVSQAMTTGHHWLGWVAERVATCARRDEGAVAVRLGLVCLEAAMPPPVTWYWFAWALSVLPSAERNRYPARPVHADTMRPWLENALTVAPMERGIFRNVACAAVVLGLHDLALEAVEGVARHQYEKLDAMRTEERLRPLFGEPRFQAVFNQPGAKVGLRELAGLHTVLPIQGVPHLVHRAVLTMVFYLSGPLPEKGAGVLRLLDAYHADVPLDALTHYKRGHFKPLTKGMMTRERKALGALVLDEGGIDICYRSSDGDASEHEFTACAWWSDVEARAQASFPVAEAEDPDAIQARFARYARASGCECAHAGFGLLNRKNDAYEGVKWNERELAGRFMGIQDSSYRWWQPGQAPPAHWLVWLSPALMGALGGVDTLRASIGEAKLFEEADGVLIRASRNPPIAPTSNPDDRGALPDVARALRPLRTPPNGAEVLNQLARWDGLPGAAYENGP